MMDYSQSGAVIIAMLLLLYDWLQPEWGYIVLLSLHEYMPYIICCRCCEIGESQFTVGNNDLSQAQSRGSGLRVGTQFI